MAEEAADDPQAPIGGEDVLTVGFNQGKV